MILKLGNQPECKGKFKQTQIYKKRAFKSIRKVVAEMKILMAHDKTQVLKVLYIRTSVSITFYKLLLCFRC